MSMKIRTLSKTPRNAFTLVELIFVILIVFILIGMLLPATRGVREPARRTACSNNLRQLVLANLNYESAHRHFPSAMGGLDTVSSENASRVSGLVSILPFLEREALFNEISNPLSLDGVDYPAFPDPGLSDYPPWNHRIEDFLCPTAFGPDSKFGQTNYAYCIGDMARGIHHPEKLRGAFGCLLKSKLSDITDGTSNTIAMAEFGTEHDRLVRGQFAVKQSDSILDNPAECLELVRSKNKAMVYDDSVLLGQQGRGGRWADGSAGYSLFNTILPPNSPSAAVGGTEEVDGIYSAGSGHVGGLNVCMADGSVRFISENVDAGDSSQPTLRPEQFAEGPIVSPYGVWGALGTANGEDIIDEDW